MRSLTENYHLNYRPDIDGLRAVAIILVIIFHAFPKFLKGGFIGVDIFFVISGYLITSIIIKGQLQGNFSLLDFYSRRIKRIFPSLITVLTFCLGAGWFVLLAGEYQSLGKHIAGGSVYLSNFILQSESGYFDNQAEFKPLLHLWSLCIEEQFYLVFPLLLIIAHRVGIDKALIISLCLICSFLINIKKINGNPTEVFYFPHTRAWELLIGGMLASILFRFDFKKIKQAEPNFNSGGENKKFTNLLAWTGVILILAAWFFFDSKKILFPSWWALAPALGAALLILAGEKSWFNRKILASKIAINIGLISYPLYLWHWVLLSFVRMIEIENQNTWLRLAVLLISFILAALTYHFVEKQIRFRSHRLVSFTLLLALLLTGVVGYSVLDHQGFPQRFSNEMNWISGDIGNEIYRSKGWVSQKNCAAKYAGVSYEKLPDDQFCLIQNIDKPATALLVGDSHANHLYPGLALNPAVTGGNLINLGAAACLPIFNNSKYPNKRCPGLINGILEMAVDSPSIGTIFLANRAITDLNEKSYRPKRKLFDFFSANKNNEGQTDPFRIFEDGLRKTLVRLTNANKKIIFILDIPELEFDPIACRPRPWRISEATAKTPCAVPLVQVQARHSKYLNSVDRVLADFPRVKVWDPLSALCDANYCWAIKDDKMLYRDDNHLNEQGSIYLGKHINFS